MIDELDVVDESDQITHLLRVEEAGETEDILSKEDSALLDFALTGSRLKAVSVKVSAVEIQYAFGQPSVWPCKSHRTLLCN